MSNVAAVQPAAPSTLFITAERYHDISCGHRVVGHEGKCRNLHGHNYRITFTVHAPALDELGRVMDFSAIKEKLCMWLEEEWDHKMILWEKDPDLRMLRTIDPTVVDVPFNPTAENMGKYLIEFVGPCVLPPGMKLIHVTIEETRKCSANVSI